MNRQHSYTATRFLLTTCLILATIVGWWPTTHAGAQAPAMDDIAIIVNSSTMTTRGRILNDHTMVALTPFARELGMSAMEDVPARKAGITYGGMSIAFILEGFTATSGGHTTQVVPGATVMNGVVCVPLRYLAEEFGFRVEWDNVTRAVSLSPEDSNPIRIVTVENKQETTDLIVNIQYPRMEGAANATAQTAFNQHFEKLAAACLESGKKNAADWASTKSPSDPRMVRVDEYLDYRVTYNRNDLISIVTSQYEYTGGAHGMTYQASYTMDLKTGKVYSLPDLFKSDAGYVAAISEQVKKQFAELEYPTLTPFESIRNDQDFYVKGDSIVVYFQLYEYTPYAAGFPEFSIKLTTLEAPLDTRFAALAQEAAVRSGHLAEQVVRDHFRWQNERDLTRLQRTVTPDRRSIAWDLGNLQYVRITSIAADNSAVQGYMTNGRGSVKHPAAVKAFKVVYEVRYLDDSKAAQRNGTYTWWYFVTKETQFSPWLIDDWGV